MRVLIVGAGIGGLTLGIALERAGHAVTIFRWIRDRSYSFGRVAQMTSPVGRWFRDLAVRLTPASVNDRVLRRILTDMRGVPLERAAPVVHGGRSARPSPTP